jgi:hypothetical protein
VTPKNRTARPSWQAARPRPDKHAGLHIQANLLEDVTTELLNRWMSARNQRFHRAVKYFNNFREVLHKMFVYAVKHHGFASRDRRYPNPVDGVERRPEPASQIPSSSAFHFLG